MKTDKELLELAAKAAGVVGIWEERYSPSHDYYYAGNTTGIYTGSFIAGDVHIWNPLTDDGDALRLAVSLDMLVDGRGAWVYAEVMGESVNEDARQDPLAATRRAIVRAAAAIGEKL